MVNYSRMLLRCPWTPINTSQIADPDPAKCKEGIGDY